MYKLIQSYLNKMNRIKLILITALLLLVNAKSRAESYETALGFRLGGVSSGITVKHFISSNAALEGILSFGGHTFLITGLYEKHQEFPNAEGLTWFYGGGAHIGFINSNYGYYDYYYHGHGKYNVNEDNYDARFLLGADFIIGLDYKIKNAPIDLSLDVKPMLDIIPGFYGYWEGALSFRFTL
jgi:hypothetical protein